MNALRLCVPRRSIIGSNSGVGLISEPTCKAFVCLYEFGGGDGARSVGRSPHAGQALNTMVAHHVRQRIAELFDLVPIRT